MKKTTRTHFRILSCVLTVCLLLGGFSVGQFMVAADEVTGYQNEAVVCFKNVGSGKYLNVHYGQNANNVNVYQWTKDESTEQEFRLRYNLEDDCYLIGAMCSSSGNGRVLDIVKSGGEVADGCNVQIYNAVDPVAQQWQIRYEGNGNFAIYPIDNYFLLLTANGNSNGSSSGTSATSAGNVYLSEIGLRESPNNYQLWKIEEVTPQATIASGTYRIKNANGKFITADADDLSNVYQLRDPGNISGLGALEQSTLLGQQLWEVTHLHSGYYLIRLAKDPTQKLGATGDFSTIQATAHITTQTDTSDCLVQWKIVPNVQGGYRIVNKGDYNTQALTVLYGDTDDETPIVMSPYVNATSQQWTFGYLPTCPSSRGGYGYGQVLGHVLALGDNPLYYKCLLCAATFEVPQQEDFSILLDEDLLTVFALQRAARLTRIEQQDEKYAQTCYKMTDIIRSKNIYNTGDRNYECSDKNGKYVSPCQYDYTANTIDTYISIDTQMYELSDVIARNLFWSIDTVLPFPCNFLIESLQDIIKGKMEEEEEYTTAEVFSMTMETLETAMPSKTLSRISKIATAIDFVSAYICAANECTIQSGDSYVKIQLHNGSSYTTFIGHYRIEGTGASRCVRVIDEEMSITDGQTTPVMNSYKYSHYSTASDNAPDQEETGNIF